MTKRLADHGRVLGVLGLVLTAGACSKPAHAPAASAPDLPARTVSVAAVERSEAGLGTVPAVVQARQRAALAARIPASVVELPFREGESVPAGAVVVRLDDAALRSAVAAAEASAQAADTDLRRLRNLLQRGAATQREVDDAGSRAAGAQAALSGARDNLAYAALRAPFAGTLAARRVNLGDVVAPGAPLVEIEGQGGLELRATVEADLVGALRPGLQLEADVDGQPRPVRATLRAISDAGDPATHRFEVRADLPAAAGLRSGLFARLRVPKPGAPPALYVPKAAVFARGGLSGAFVAAEGRARLRWLALGAPVGERVEVRAGLEVGERVVLGPGDLSDGQPIVVK